MNAASPTPGWLVHSIPPKLVPVPSAPPLPEIIDAADLVAHPPAVPEEIVAGLLHRGSKLVIGGASKSNKTWVLADLGLSVAYGRDWLGFGCQQQKVLYLNLEVQQWAFSGRLAALCDAKSIEPEPGRMDVWNLRGYSAPFDELLPELTDRIGESGYGLVLLDPIYKLMGDRDENDAGDITEVMNAIERMADKVGAAVAFTAHFAKGNHATKASIDRISGSGVFARDPDSILMMTPLQEKDAFVIEATLRNHEPLPPIAVRWSFPLMHRDPTIDPTAIKGPPKAQRTGGKQAALDAAIMAMVPAEGSISKAMLVKQLHQAEKGGINCLQNAVKCLVHEGKLHEWRIKRAKTNPEIHVSRTPQPLPPSNPASNNEANPTPPPQHQPVPVIVAPPPDAVVPVPPAPSNNHTGLP